MDRILFAVNILNGEDYMTDKEKLEKIKEIIEETFEDVCLPISAWDADYKKFIDALENISGIVEE